MTTTIKTKFVSGLGLLALAFLGCDYSEASSQAKSYSHAKRSHSASSSAQAPTTQPYSAASAYPAATTYSAPRAYPPLITPQSRLARAEFLQTLPAPAGGGVPVCVVDSKIAKIPELTNRVISQYRVNTDPASTEIHGTLVGLTIAGQDPTSRGIWPQARLISVGITSGEQRLSDLINGIHKCSAKGDSVVNISSTFKKIPDPYLFSQTKKLFDLIAKHSNIIGAAGNAGSSVLYPAAFPSVIGVGSVDHTGTFCSHSNRNFRHFDWKKRNIKPDISALGCSVQLTVSSRTGNHYAGTSLSAPQVAGVLAAIRSYRPGMSAAKAKALLLETARHTPSGRVLDATALFRRAGLGYLVELYGPNPRPPKLKSITFNNGILDITAHRLPKGMTVAYKVGSQTFLKPTGRLRLPLSQLPTVEMFTVNKGGWESKPIPLTPPAN